MLAQIPAQHADFISFLASTGCRIGEALAARWQDLGLEGGRPALSFPKATTRAGERTITLSPEMMRRLVSRRAEAQSAESDLIFPADNGVQRDPRNFRTKTFRPAAERAGVRWATPHKLRSARLASLMAADGRSAAEIATHLGQADGGQLALKTYIHTERPVVDFIDSILGGQH